MKIVVTGGTGVLGTATIPALLRAGHEVRVLSRHADDDVRAFPRGVEPFQADITQAGTLEGAMKEVDAVIHIAGIVDEEPPDVTFDKNNVEGTRHLLDAAQRARSPYFIFVSSLGADRGESDYHASKRRAEELVRAYPGPWLILRPGNVYGPGDQTISLLLTMLRTLPAVPMVDHGDQPFQPIWCDDFGRAVAAAVDNPGLTGRTLELSGADVTTTEEVLNHLVKITGRNPPRLPVPAWLTAVGTRALEAFGAVGKHLLQSAGLDAPITSAKLKMLLEGNVIQPGTPNALVTEFHVAPTSLQKGLELLADLLPEQVPGEGVGAVKKASYSAEIHGGGFSAPELLQRVCDQLADIMPIEFAAEPGAPAQAREGGTMTGAIKGRGHIQVRLEEKTETTATFVTLEGHPLAGVMQLEAKAVGSAVRFSVHTVSQPSNIFDWVAMKVVGEKEQSNNWVKVVERVVGLSGGHAPAGVTRAGHSMSEAEAKKLESWVTRLIQQQQRAQCTAEVETGRGPGENQTTARPPAPPGPNRPPRSG